MAIRTLLKFRNLDLTKDINDRYTKLIGRGVFDGGDVVPVPAQLKVNLLPFKAVSIDGMIVQETSDTYTLDCPTAQTTVISCRAKYIQNNEPEISITATEKTVFDSLSDKDYHIVFAEVVVPLLATQVLSSYVEFKSRDIVDKLSRSSFRGYLETAALLPDSAHNNPGDFFIITDGIGGTPNIYGWDGTQWVVMTDAANVTADLASHRLNLFPDEKHLTDEEKDAVVGTSGNPPSASNPFVDNDDTRIPTQAENDALVGSDGSPSSLNKYVTEEYPLAVPEEKSSGGIPVGSFEILATDGPTYVGKDGVGTATKYFQFYQVTEPREYLTTTGTIVTPSDVFKDNILTVQLDPANDPDVDVDGFYTGSGTLYIAFSSSPDSTVRCLYGKRNILGTMPVNALLRRNINDAQTSAETIAKVEAIKGRSWDDTPPTNEQNIELRKDILDIKEYVSSVFNADHVVGDFSKVKNVPDFSDDFEENIGIPQNYKFENTGLVTFVYTVTGTGDGQVTFSSDVGLTSASITVNEDVFIDSGLDEFKVVSVLDDQNILIERRSGTIPKSIDTSSPSLSSHGSIKKDNNPRKVNLSTLGFQSGGEHLYVREIEVAKNEYHPVTRNIAFQSRLPVRSIFFKEPRLRLYGAFSNRLSDVESRVVCTGAGRILLTGFFSHVALLVDLKSASPTAVVKIDGDSVGTSYDLSVSGNVAELGTEGDFQQQAFLVASGLSTAVPHTIEIEISDTVDDFDFYGFDLYNVTTNISILPGRVFVQSDLYKSDAIITVASNVETTRSRGSVVTRYVNRTLAQQTSVTSLTDFDGAAGGPTGAVSGLNFKITSGFSKLSLYSVGDIVKLITATSIEIKRISSFTVITPDVDVDITFTTTVTGSGGGYLLHLASTDGDELDPVREYARYTISDLGANQNFDFSIIGGSVLDKIFTVEDGTTSVVASQVKYTTTGIDGAEYALEMDSASSTLRIRAVASRCDIICINSSPSSAQISLDGSDPFSIASSGSGTVRIPLWLNARYQTHEALITNAAGFKLLAIILHEPKPTTTIEGALIATQNFVGRYDPDGSSDGSLIPIGCVAIDPFISGGVYVNGSGSGTAWSYIFDLSTATAWGRDLTTDQEGAYFQYLFVGTGFELEYYAQNDKGTPTVSLNGTLATSANFPTAVFVKVDASNSNVDMYDVSATPVRKKFAIYALPLAAYTVKVQIQNPRQKNGSSSGWKMTLGSFYGINYEGKLSSTPSSGYKDADFAIGPSSFRDDRNFDSGSIAREEIPVFRPTFPQLKSQEFVTNSIWVVPENVTEVNLFGFGGGMGGGGGSGGQGNSVSGNGGNGGLSAVAATQRLSVTPGDTVTITIGAGGAGGAGSSGTVSTNPSDGGDGSDGGDTLFDPTGADIVIFPGVKKLTSKTIGGRNISGNITVADQTQASNFGPIAQTGGSGDSSGAGGASSTPSNPTSVASASGYVYDAVASGGSAGGGAGGGAGGCGAPGPNSNGASGGNGGSGILGVGPAGNGSNGVNASTNSGAGGGGGGGGGKPSSALGTGGNGGNGGNGGSGMLVVQWIE
jgi:hypothetical protein